MSREQVLAEKLALQKALLCLEERHGRPAQKRDRDMVRPLYERYRLVKRLVTKSGSVSVCGGGDRSAGEGRVLNVTVV